MLGGAYRFTSGHLAAIVRIHEITPATEIVPADRTATGPRSRSRQSAGPQTLTPLRPRPRTGPRRAA
jgi:hypothetical protein